MLKYIKIRNILLLSAALNFFHVQAQTWVQLNEIPFDVGRVEGIYPGDGIAKRHDGKILVTGSGQFVNDHYKPNFYRLNADLTLDISFSVPASFSGGESLYLQSQIDFQSDGKTILAHGPGNITRLNDDGSIDETFKKGTGFNDLVRAIKVDADDRIIAFGYFTTYNGNPASGIVRLNSDGTIDNTFSASVTCGRRLSDIHIQNDGKIVLVSKDMMYNEIHGPYQMLRLHPDGSRDDSFTYPFAEADPFIILPSEANKLIIVGIANEPFTGLARLNADGSIDETYTQSEIYTISPRSAVMQTDGKVVAFGPGGLLRFNANGTVDETFNTPSMKGYSGVAIANNGTILAQPTDGNLLMFNEVGTGINTGLTYKVKGSAKELIVTSDGIVLIGGNVENEKILSFNPDGAVNSNFQFFSNNPVSAIYTKEDGTFYVTGEIPGHIALVNPDGGKNHSFSAGSGFNDYVSHVTILEDGKLLVAGNFTSYNGEAGKEKLVKLNSDGSLDQSFAIDDSLLLSPFTDILTSVRQNDGKIIVGIGNLLCSSCLVRLNEDGSRDDSFNVIAAEAVNYFKKDAGGRVYYTETYPFVDGPAMLGRLHPNGTLDESFDDGTGFNSVISSIKIQDAGKIIVGGAFSSYNGINVPPLIRLNTDGTIDNSFVIPGEFNLSGETATLRDVLKFDIYQNDIILVGDFDVDGENRTAAIRLGIDTGEPGDGDDVPTEIPKPDFESTLLVYPNPSRGLFHVHHLTKDILRYQILSTTGITKSNGTINGNSPLKTLDLTSFPPGIYILRIKKGEVVSDHKLVKVD